VRAATVVRAKIARHLDRLLADGGVLFLPSAPGPPPAAGPEPGLGLGPTVGAGSEPGDTLGAAETFRTAQLRLTTVAGLGGLPQVTLPVVGV